MSLEKSEKFLKVIDSSLTLDHAIRTHQVVINGEVSDVVFKYGEDKLLPESVAMKFSKEGFRIVHIEDDAEIYIPREIPIGAPVQLKPDEVIARYTELTFEALRTRAVILPGGEKFIQDGVQSQDIIDFLIGGEPVIDGEEELCELEDEEGDDLDETFTDKGATDTEQDAEDIDAQAPVSEDAEDSQGVAEEVATDPVSDTKEGE